MRGLLVFVASGLGLGAFWRRRRRRLAADELPYEPSGTGPDHAAELRAKLAETKAAGDEPDPVTGDEPPEGELPAAERSPLDPQVRREAVHERARASIDDLG